MTKLTAQLRREIEAERSALADNLHELEIRARELTDWRAQVRKHPVASVGVALAGGLAIGMYAGRRRRRVTHEPVAGNGGGNGNGATRPSTTWAMMSHPIVVRAAETIIAIAAGKAVQMLNARMSEKDEEPEPELAER